MGARCSRFNAAGVACRHSTSHADGWCRQDDCEGYVRPAVVPLAEASAARVRNPDAAPWVETAPGIGLEPHEAYEVSVTRRACEEFVAAHGVSEASAEAQIRALLEDALRAGRARRRSASDPSWQVELLGYFLTVSSDLEAVTFYRTYHRDRTYAQVAAGVPSRAPGQRDPRRDGVLQYQDGPPVPVDEAPRRVDVAGLLLTRRARNSFHVARPDLRATSDGDFDEALRAAVRADLAGPVTVTVRDSGLYMIEGASGWSWTVSPGLVALVGVKAPARPDLVREGAT